MLDFVDWSDTFDQKEMFFISPFLIFVVWNLFVYVLCTLVCVFFLRHYQQIF